MPDIKLSKLPDRTPVKITITVTPDLSKQLHVYAELYRETYGDAEPVPELIPYILQSFIESDRGYVRALKVRQPDTPIIDKAPTCRSRRKQGESAETGVPDEK